LEHVFYFNFVIFLDFIEKFIGKGAAAAVYSAVLKEKKLKMAVKAYFPVKASEKLPIDRDMFIGFELRLKTEYTLKYEDTFDAGPFKCVVMELMTNSLENLLSPLIHSNPKKYLSDEVCSYFYLFINFFFDRKSL
jgi:serine/threonine protein kinase